MTAENFKKGMLILRETFPERFGEMDKTAMRVWFQILNDIPDQEWENSVLYICRNHEKPPVPATVRQIVQQGGHVLSAEEAWAIVWCGVRLGQHKYDDPVVQKTYDAIGYTTWRNLTYSDANTVRAHFYRTYEAMKKRIEMDEEMLAIGGSKGVKLMEYRDYL
jgi:hypothetical protein